MADYAGGSAIGATSSIAGLVWSATCTANGTATTAICAALAGFGNDYFNSKYYIQIVYNASGAGASPEPKVRKITDYVSATGTFTFGTVTDATAIGDKIIIMHESLAAIGRDGTNSDYSSNNVVADKKGDIQERLEAAQVDLTAILAAVGAGMDLRTEKSDSGPVEANGFEDFDIAIFDVDLGAVLAADIDITAISVSLARSRAGADFSTVGITQPVFAKATGRVYCSFQFVSAQWAEGDLYKLVVTGIKATVDTGVVYIPTAVWSNAILAPGMGAGILAEVEASSLNIGGGTNASLSRSGILQRYIADSVSTGIKQLTQAPASASATVITDANITETFNFKGALVLVLSGTNAGSSRPVVVSAVGSVTVYPPFDTNVLAGETAILISAWRPNVWNQQADVAVNTTATNAAETTIFDLSVAGYSYMVNTLRLKFADPGANTITVRLYELINDVLTQVDSITVDTTNYATYYSLMDMFGINCLTGDSLKVTIRVSGGGPYACTGQYQYALARTS